MTNRRRRHRRQQTDRFGRAARRLLIGTGTVGAVYGQAEMLGEPWRHVLAIAGVSVLLGILVLLEWQNR